MSVRIKKNLINVDKFCDVYKKTLLSISKKTLNIFVHIKFIEKETLCKAKRRLH